WPLSVAPYHVLITIVNTKIEQQVNAGFEIYETLKKSGVEVLIDDRNERAGVKFADADLIGIPIRVTVGKGIDDGLVEFSLRSDREKTEIAIADVIEKIKLLITTDIA
ncbi:MAG TPA: His/Gly/Thr/Pro-type tRNA ligase C-terminal domain-containing protein, partial [Fusibacter sp.]|nr:His/Gly/Thr/Pro-type tRNA ligase C-terminal domain-containing protein [Fusibacter sp.]